MEAPITFTDLEEFKKISTGKVRDLYDYNDTLLFVATDRISAFDVILSSVSSVCMAVHLLTHPGHPK